MRQTGATPRVAAAGGPAAVEWARRFSAASGAVLHTVVQDAEHVAADGAVAASQDAQLLVLRADDPAVLDRVRCPTVLIGATADDATWDDGRPVVVAVPSDPRALPVLLFAARYAQQTGRPIRVVHASGRRRPPRDRIEVLIGFARQWNPDVPVTAVVARGRVRRTLVAQAADAHVVVVGRYCTGRHARWSRRGRATARLATQLDAPVVVVGREYALPSVITRPVPEAPQDQRRRAR
ncbi:MAG: hypothetical protein ACTHMS_00035 [Jatrophihabitans sp.]|uniref:hypothetical protein n=1 Tax=Jatrophihabitans sp. TaxID=1932789 RepID=UPI003F813D0D